MSCSAPPTAPALSKQKKTFILRVHSPTANIYYVLSQDGTVYTGRFEAGRPKGEGKFVFPNGISQQGFYEAVVEEDADKEEPPALLWRGQSVVTC